MINEKWQLGVQDQGHGHSTYAILDKDGEILMVVGDNFELADRIIWLHNTQLEKENVQQTE